ncbi:lipopolysaccharide biosynthesis protein [Ferrigenium kumadai]|uniref:lipopolysaccharide biosynthesis protein n=1 Tax=Ferrigenium kumadai TaxID=1682490 RepID=UPI001BB45B9C|nr:oligosaccharide flippase family protein [Ferrigenium kumadai]
MKNRRLDLKAGALTTERRQIFFWTVLFTGANIGVKGALVLVVMLLASVLSPAAYADFGMLYALQGAMATFAVMGLTEVTAGRLKTHSSGRRRQFLFRQMSGLFWVMASLSLILVAPIIAMVVLKRDLLGPAIFAILLGASISYGVLQASFHRIEERHAASLLSSAGIPLGGVIGLVVGGWWSQDLGTIFGLGFLGAGLALVALFLAGKIYVGQVRNFLRVRRDIVVLAPFLAMGIFGWLSGYGMNFIIDLRFEPSYVASFTFLFTVASIGQMIANSLNMVWAPRFYRMFNEGHLDQAEPQNRYFFSILAVVLGVAGALAVGLLPWVTGFIGGNLNYYGNYRLEFALLIVGYIVCIPWWHGQNYYLVAGFGRELMRLALWSGGVGLVVWVICMIALGPIGIFLGFPLQMVIKSITMWMAGSRHWTIRPPWTILALASAMTFAAVFLPLPA